MSQIDLSNVEFPDQMDLRTASIFVGLSEMRVRTLARDGVIPASKDDSGAWVFELAQLKVFKATPRVRKSGGQRGDGKLWIIRIKYVDLEAVKGALAQYGIELQPRYNYAKQTEYRLKKAAAAAASASKSKAK